jgi:hypothetical protein
MFAGDVDQSVAHAALDQPLGGLIDRITLGDAAKIDLHPALGELERSCRGIEAELARADVLEGRAHVVFGRHVRLASEKSPRAEPAARR